MEFRTEFYNLFNRVQFGLPNLVATSAANSTFELINRRRIRLAFCSSRSVEILTASATYFDATGCWSGGSVCNGVSFLRSDRSGSAIIRKCPSE